MTLSLLDAIPYLRRYDGATFVVKAGGALLARPDWLSALARDVAALHRLGVRVVLVHGGGPQLDAACRARGLPQDKVAGRRITTPEHIVAAAEVWRGRVALQVVAALARHGERALSVSGAEAGLVRAARRPPRVIVDDDGVRQTVDFGRVGDIERVDPAVLHALLDAHCIPVVSPLAYADDGRVLNVNADTMAACIATSVGAAKLVLLTRTPGILRDPADPSTALHWTDLAGLAELRATGAISAGMRPKVDAIRVAIDGGVPRVHVVDGRTSGALLQEVFTNAGCGTLVVESAEDTPEEPAPLRKPSRAPGRAANTPTR